MGRALPSGRVTFVFTDVVGSTQAFARFGDRYIAAVRLLHDLIATTTDAFGGAVVSTDGDGAFLAFPTGSMALASKVRRRRRRTSPTRSFFASAPAPTPDTRCPSATTTSRSP